MTQQYKQTIYHTAKARPESQQIIKDDPKAAINSGIKFNEEYQLNDSFPSLYYNTRFDESSFYNNEERPSSDTRKQTSLNI